MIRDIIILIFLAIICFVFLYASYIIGFKQTNNTDVHMDMKKAIKRKQKIKYGRNKRQ